MTGVARPGRPITRFGNSRGQGTGWQPIKDGSGGLRIDRIGRAISRILLPCLLILPLEAGATDCPAAANRLNHALENEDVSAARESFDAIWDAQDCSDRFRANAGRVVANLHARMAQKQIDMGHVRLGAQEAFLEQALGYGRTWPVLALLGDIASEQRDRGAAVGYYQEALVVMDDVVLTPTPPSEAQIMRIHRLAQASNLLTSKHRLAPVTRSGEPGGLAAANIRGFVVEQVAMPITFDTGSARFTERGKKAVAEMGRVLKVQNPLRIAIEGHTDLRGSDDYNLVLSRKRAEAVKHYLVDHGFTGQIDIRAMGESAPFPRDTLGDLTRDELWQLDRRVELIRR